MISFVDADFLAGLMTVSYVIGIIVSVVCAVICALLARKKGRSVVGWVFGGLFLGWIGVIIIACLSPINKPNDEYYDQHKDE